MDAQRVLHFMQGRSAPMTTQQIAEAIGMPAGRVLVALGTLNDEAGVYRKDGGWCGC